jgi:hypothetical protein
VPRNEIVFNTGIRAKGYYFMNNPIFCMRKTASPLAENIDKGVPPSQERANFIRAPGVATLEYYCIHLRPLPRGLVDFVDFNVR